jgi:hypothetical protein
MRATFRPLPAWPYPEQPARPATYQAGYARTLQDLEREIEALSGREVIIGVVTDEASIRIDGMMRADAKVRHPGVEVSFELPDRRRLTFHTDRHKGYTNSWQHNLRAVALGLEALRAVDRYGITSAAEQYAGFAQLTAGGPSADRGRVLVAEAGSVTEALKRHHPDHGGQAEAFADVQAYRELVAGKA